MHSGYEVKKGLCFGGVAWDLAGDSDVTCRLLKMSYVAKYRNYVFQM